MTSIFAHAVLLALVIAPIAAHAEAPTIPSKGAIGPAAAEPAPAAPIAPDRPGFTNGSDTIAPSHIQLETGIAQTYFQSSFGGGSAVDYPEALLRRGLTPKLELRVGLPDFTRQDGTPSGYGDASLGFKYKLSQSGNGNTKFAVTPAITLPTGGAQHGTQHVDPLLTFGAQTVSGARWGVSVNLALADPTQNGERNAQAAPSVAASYQLTPALSTYGEIYDNFPKRGGPSPLADGGFTYAANVNLQYDLEMGIGLGAAAPVRFYGGGVSVRF